MSENKPRKLPPKNTKCNKKAKYLTREKAEEVADRRSKAAGHEIHAYWCHKHQSFHIGRIAPC